MWSTGGSPRGILRRRWRPGVPGTSWPSVCALCHGWGRGRVCASCLARHGAPRPRCDRCALPLDAGTPRRCGACLLRPPPQDATIAAVDYAPPWDGLIARFKFHDALDLGPVLAGRLAARIEAAGAPRPDWLLPAPLSPARLAERGYNQAWELARHLSRRLGCPARPDLLLRPRHGERQMALPRDERAANVRDAYAVEPARRAQLAGRRVALVDDVVTTGATAEEMVRTLRAAGAVAVQVWTVARTPSPG